MYVFNIFVYKYTCICIYVYICIRDALRDLVLVTFCRLYDCSNAFEWMLTLLFTFL